METAIENAINVLADLFTKHVVPKFIQSQNGLEFTAKTIRNWRGRDQIKALHVKRGSPCENKVSITLHPWVRSGIRGTNLVIQAHDRQGGPTDTMVPGSFQIRLFGDEYRFRIRPLACQALLEILGHRTRCKIRSSEVTFRATIVDYTTNSRQRRPARASLRHADQRRNENRSYN